MYIVAAYVVYLTISLALTVWVARTLERNGRVFLIDALQGNAELADSVNRLLVVGFYLINVGYVTLALVFYKLRKRAYTALRGRAAGGWNPENAPLGKVLE